MLGASLIGDDCNKAISVNKLDSRAISLDASMMSEPLSYGIDHMLTDMVRLLALRSHHGEEYSQHPWTERTPKRLADRYRKSSQNP